MESALDEQHPAHPGRPIPTIMLRRMEDGEIRRWREDLDVLVRNLLAIHPNPFHTVASQQWAGWVTHLRNGLPALARHQIVVELMRLSAAIGDGHTGVMPWRDPVGFHTLPIALYRFADGYYVRAARNDHADLVGARVTELGGLPIEAAEQLVAPLVGRDNEQGVAMYAPILLAMPEVLHAVGLAKGPLRAEMTVDDGRLRKVVLDAAGLYPLLSVDQSANSLWGPREGWVDLRDTAEVPLWLSHLKEPFWFCHPPGTDLLYCQLNAIRECAFEDAVIGAEGARRFVLDLRHNNGGNGDLTPAFVRPLLKSTFDQRGRLFVITDRRTFSAAQMLICALERWTFPIFVGEPSSSRDNHYGDSELVVLPHHGITVRVSSLWWQWDPRMTRAWIPVDLDAPLSAHDYRTGRDAALAAITRY